MGPATRYTLRRNSGEYNEDLIFFLIRLFYFCDIARGIPTTVEEFLSMIDLPQYNSALQDNGWDSVEFLG